ASSARRRSGCSGAGPAHSHLRPPLRGLPTSRPGAVTGAPNPLGERGLPIRPDSLPRADRAGTRVDVAITTEDALEAESEPGDPQNRASGFALAPDPHYGLRRTLRRRRGHLLG